MCTKYVGRLSPIISSDYARYAQLQCAHAVVVAECAALLTNDHCIQRTWAIGRCIFNCHWVILQCLFHVNITIIYTCNHRKSNVKDIGFPWAMDCHELNVPWIDIFLLSALSPTSFDATIVLLIGWSTSTDAGRPRLLIAMPMPPPWIYMFTITMEIRNSNWNGRIWHKPDFELEVHSMHVVQHGSRRPQFQHAEREWIVRSDWSQSCHCLNRHSEFVCRRRFDASIGFCDSSRSPEQSSWPAYSCWRWALGAWELAMAVAEQNFFAGMWFVPVR